MKDLQDLKDKGCTNREISEITGLTYHQVVERFRRPRNNRRKALKKKAINYLGGKCRNCGYNRCMDCLDFHYRDPATRQFSINKLIRDTGAWNTLRSELDKCVLLCCICHKEANAGLININNF